ncbi:MAG: hypothetical protein JWP52_4635 [Rhizobacter sp.]|nr:hypothetical protein [Rhizobacter sp.]
MSQTVWRMAQSGPAGSVVFAVPEPALDGSPAPAPVVPLSLTGGSLAGDSVTGGSVTSGSAGAASAGRDTVGTAASVWTVGVEALELVDRPVSGPGVGEPAVVGGPATADGGSTVVLPGATAPVDEVVPGAPGTTGVVVVPGTVLPGVALSGLLAAVAEVELVPARPVGEPAEDAAVASLVG